MDVLCAYHSRDFGDGDVGIIDLRLGERKPRPHVRHVVLECRPLIKIYANIPSILLLFAFKKYHHSLSAHKRVVGQKDVLTGDINALPYFHKGDNFIQPKRT